MLKNIDFLDRDDGARIDFDTRKIQIGLDTKKLYVLKYCAKKSTKEA